MMNEEELKKGAREEWKNWLKNEAPSVFAQDIKLHELSGITDKYIDKAYKSGEEAERERCMKDVCSECNGNCPPYESKPSKKPNAAGNYTHKAKDGSDDVLCQASNIISRSNFKGEALSILNKLSKEESTIATTAED